MNEIIFLFHLTHCRNRNLFLSILLLETLFPILYQVYLLFLLFSICFSTWDIGLSWPWKFRSVLLSAVILSPKFVPKFLVLIFLPKSYPKYVTKFPTPPSTQFLGCLLKFLPRSTWWPLMKPLLHWLPKKEEDNQETSQELSWGGCWKFRCIFRIGFR